MTDLHDHETTPGHLAEEDPSGQAAEVTRRGLLLGLSTATIAALASSASVLASSAPAGAIAVTGLLAGAGNGVANREALQAAIDAAPAGATLQLPGGTYEIDVAQTSVYLPRSITLSGAVSTPTVFDLVPTVFDLQAAPQVGRSFLVVYDRLYNNGVGQAVMSGVFRFRDFTVNGPTQANAVRWTSSTDEQTREVFAIGWTARGSVGQFDVERVTITGCLHKGIYRSGKGITRVVDCDIAAYVSCLDIYESSDTPDASGAIVRGGTQTTGSTTGLTTKTSSAGTYIHPCVALLMSDVTFVGFQRYGLYINGSMGSVPKAVVVDKITIDGCGGVVQTPTNGQPIFTRMRVKNGQPGQGGTLKGSATFVDCHFTERVDFSFGGNHPDVLVQFISCWIDTTGNFMNQGQGFGGTNGTVRFSGCTALMSAGSQLLDNATSGWSGVVELLDCEIYACGTTHSRHVQIQRGSLYIDNTTVFTNLANPIAVDPGRPVTGAATVVAATTCPTPPS